MSRTLSHPLHRSLGIAALALAAAWPAQAIVGATPSPNFLAVGQGIQVTPDWVLTVQHYALNPGDSYVNGYGLRTVAARYDAPGSGAFPTNDFALLRLSPANGSSAVPLLAVSDFAVPNGSFAAQAVTLASAANTSGPRSYAYTTISESQVMVDPDDGGPQTPVLANWLISWDSVVYVQGGDSGSAMFAGQVLDSGLLLGLASALLTDANDQPIGSGYVQPAAYRSWVDATMAADTADGQFVLWTSAVPEPAALALWTAGLVVLIGAARRRD